jgi:hypothetical protein
MLSIVGVQNLAAEKTYSNLDITLEEAIKHRREVCYVCYSVYCLIKCRAGHRDVAINGKTVRVVYDYCLRCVAVV